MSVRASVLAIYSRSSLLFDKAPAAVRIPQSSQPMSIDMSIWNLNGTL